MYYIGPIISVFFIVVTATLLLKRYNPQGVLLTAGLTMLVVSMVLNYDCPSYYIPQLQMDSIYLST